MKLHELDALIKTVCPIDGVNSDGVIWFKPEVTEAQKIEAQTILAVNFPKLVYDIQ